MTKRAHADEWASEVKVSNILGVGFYFYFYFFFLFPVVTFVKRLSNARPKFPFRKCMGSLGGLSVCLPCQLHCTDVH